MQKLRFCIIFLAAACCCVTCRNPINPINKSLLKKIDIAAIQGICIPEAGRKPTAAINETEQYTGTVAWSPAVPETFAVNTEYTAAITLTAKDGYTLLGVAENFFTVDGAESTSNSENSGDITASFPPTSPVFNLAMTVIAQNSPLTPIAAGIFTVAVNGFIDDSHAANTVLDIAPLPGLSFNGHDSTEDAAGGVKTFTVTVSCYEASVFDSSAIVVTINSLTGFPDIYSYSNGSQTTVITIADGQDISRAIPVNQANIAAFNEYANTEDGLRRHYKLTEDVTLPDPAPEESNWTEIGTVYTSFTGSFDGQNYTVLKLIINDANSIYSVGMFGAVSRDAVIKNLGLANGSVIAAKSGTTGGVIGSILDGTVIIQNCYFTGNVIGPSNAGGVVGEIIYTENMHRSIVENCYFVGTITGSTAGGIVGYNNFGIIQNCYSAANVYNINSASGSAGGIVGDNKNIGIFFEYPTYGGIVQNCYAAGNVFSENKAGGITGSNGFIVRNSVALNQSVTSMASGVNLAGRVAGSPSYNMIANNYAQSAMPILYTSAGIDKPVNAGLTTADGEDIASDQYNEPGWWQNAGNWIIAGDSFQLVSNDSFSWDFSNVWGWNSATGLPVLRNMPSGTQNHTADKNTQAAFTGVTANGSAALSTTKLTLCFDKDIPGLSAGNITLSGSSAVIKGELAKNAAGGSYELIVYVTSSSGPAAVTVTVKRAGYEISSASRDVIVYHCGTPGPVTKVTFNGETETVNFINLNNNNIYLVKVNTSPSVVNAAATGSVFTLFPILPDSIEASPASADDLPLMGHPAASAFNANPPPIEKETPRRLRAAFTAPVVGDTRNFWVENSVDSGVFIQKQATLRATGLYCNIWVMDENYSGWIGSGNRITSGQAQTLANKFDALYPPATSLLGYEYGGGPGGDGGKDGDPKVQILAYSISSSIGGYFWAKDFYEDSQLPAGQKSNLAEIYYINTVMVNSSPDLIYSALVHEFQHMINFNVKTVQHGKNSATWYNEMLSMMAEDIISPLIGISPSNAGHPIRQRIPAFLSSYYNNGITEWNSSLNDYAGKYAFGAYLLRNYGGAELLQKILSNNASNIESITAALSEISEELNFQSALTSYGEAFIYSGLKMPPGLLTFDKTVTSTVNSVTYTAQGFDIWSSFTQKGPTVLSLNQKGMRPYSITVHSDSGWNNVSGNFSLTLQRPDNANIALFLMVK